MQYIYFSLRLCLFLLIVSCTQDNSLDHNSDPVVVTNQAIQTNTNSAEKTAESKNCSDGESPQVLSGDCSGTWKLHQLNGDSYCTYTWGPMVKCPQGTKSMGYEAVCYGATDKKLDKNRAGVDESYCASQFGKVPSSPKYELKCCKN